MAMTRARIVPIVIAILCPFVLADTMGDETEAQQRRHRAQEFHFLAQQRTGVLVPMYVYPADIHKNAEYNQLIDIKRRHASVPMWVIVNPASGPGKKVDGNYTKAIDRLIGSGCVVLGYVTTSYGKRPEAEVHADIDQWLKMYPRTHGIFFDEMIYEDTDIAAGYQAKLNQYAHNAGCWPTVGNPGADTPGRYFATNAADVIIVHEGNQWPDEKRLKGDYFGGYADYAPFTRGILLHSQPTLKSAPELQTARKYVRWVYVTDKPYRANDPAAANPWNSVSKHLEELCKQLESN